MDRGGGVKAVFLALQGRGQCFRICMLSFIHKTHGPRIVSYPESTQSRFCLFGRSLEFVVFVVERWVSDDGHEKCLTL